MCRSKKVLAALIGLCLMASSALAQSDSLISDEMIKTETVNYSKTALVENTVFERSFSASATEYYPHTYPIACEVDNASFVEYNVNRKHEVKAGDVLATFAVDVDEEALSSVQFALMRTQENYEKEKLEQQEAIEKLLKERVEIRDVYERELMTLRIERAQLALEQYCFQQDTQIASLQEQLDEMQEKNSRTQLIAPFDGVITDMVYKREGERVYNGEVLITLYREDGMLLRIDNSSLNFRYGMEMVVASGSKKDPVLYHGRIVAADNQLLSSRRLGHAFIQLDDLPEGTRLSRLTATGVSQYLGNVMVVPRRAIAMDGGKYYVECLFDGSLQKRFVNVGLTNSANAWVLQGIHPGDTVIID